EGDALAVGVDAHDADHQLLARFVRLRRIAARRHADLRIRDQSRETRLELDEDAGRGAVIHRSLDHAADRIALVDVLPRIIDRDRAQRQREALLRGIDFAHPTLHAGADRHFRVARLHAVRQLGDVYESVETRLHFDEVAE